MLLQKDELHIWKLDLIDSFQQVEELYLILSNDEQHRANSFYHDEPRRNFIITRGVLRKIIGGYLKKDPCQVEFSYNKYGKPFVKEKYKSPYLHFNLSHSENIALYIIAKDVEVGIDIEKISPLEQLHSVAKQFFSPREISFIKNTPQPHQLEVFFRIWTRKEAFVKAIGTGLSFPLQDFDVISGTNKVALCRKNELCEIFAHEWNLDQIVIQDDYTAAIAYPKLRKILKYLTYTTDCFASIKMSGLPS